jgi:hypothetical protein
VIIPFGKHCSSLRIEFGGMTEQSKSIQDSIWTVSQGRFKIQCFLDFAGILIVYATAIHCLSILHCMNRLHFAFREMSDSFLMMSRECRIRIVDCHCIKEKIVANRTH